MSVVDVMPVRVVSVRPDDSVQTAIARMAERNVGSVAVCDGAKLVGIFTERDVLRLASGGAHFGEARVGDVMTTALVTVPADCDIVHAAKLMGEHGIRHLPVLEGENLLGVVGIRDVLGALVERLWRAHDAAAHDTARELLRRR